VEFVLALTLSSDQPRRFQNVEVLRDSLARERKLVLHRQPRTKLQQGLPIAFHQFIDDRAPRRRPIASNTSLTPD
jgi:hypothetical protein